MRKTIALDNLRRQHEAITGVNWKTGGSSNDEINGILIGANHMLTDALISAGQYNGFMYVDMDGNNIGLSHPLFNEYRRRYL